jgi:hypothetical protein
MKNAVVAGLAMLVAFFSPASAQSLRASLIVDVPFRFHIGQQTFAPGVYSFSSENGVMRVAEGNGAPKARILTNSLSRTSSTNAGQAVFSCYRQECFLFRVWIADKGAQILTSPMENEFRKRRETGVYMALLGQ